MIQLGMRRGNKGKSLYQSDSGLHHTINLNYTFRTHVFSTIGKNKNRQFGFLFFSTFGKNTFAGLVNQMIKNKWPDFLMDKLLIFC